MISRAKLTREVSEASKSQDEDIILKVVNDNMYKWRGIIKGPPETPYEKGNFELDFQIPKEYPLRPPKVRFLTKVFHPNIHFKTGEICLDILKAEHWTPAWSLETLCRAIINLLTNPNADSPLNCDAGNLIRAGDLRGFNSMASMYTREIAFYVKFQRKT